MPKDQENTLQIFGTTALNFPARTPPTIPIDATDLPIVVVKRFQIFVTIQRAARESHVIGTQGADVFEVLILDELHHNVLFRLDLQHFQDEAYEGSGPEKTKGGQ